MEADAGGVVVAASISSADLPSSSSLTKALCGGSLLEGLGPAEGASSRWNPGVPGVAAVLQLPGL